MTRPHVFIAVASVCAVLLMFGSRFQTLTFGKVFPERDPNELVKVEALTARVSDLEAKLKAFEAAHQGEPAFSAQSESPLEVAREPAVTADEFRKLLDMTVALSNRVNILEKGRRARPASSSPQRGEDTGAPTATGVVHRGDDAATVRRVFGRPERVISTGNLETWYYPGSHTVGFEDGRVYEWDGMPVEP